MPETGFFTARQVRMLPHLPLLIEKKRQLELVPPHGHEFVEIAFVAAGSALHIHRDRAGRIRTGGLVQGDLFSVLVGEEHGYERCGSMVLYNIFIREEALAGYAALRELPGWPLLFGERADAPEICIHLPAPARLAAAQCLERALGEYRFMPPGYAAVMRAQLLEFLAVAMRNGDSNRRRFFAGGFDMLESISMLEERPAGRFSLARLARAANMSVASYTRKFRAATGMSPMQYLLDIRLRQACHYLATTGMSIGEIASECGFCTPDYLIRRFRRKFGTTPGRYRERERREDQK